MHDIFSFELLAPAGNAAALHAAVRAGADAVYLGLETFNARRGADNFTMPTFREACRYAHLRGVKVYVTLNTVILPSEVKAAMECARQAWRAGADAFIVQDLGLADEMRRSLPQARLHVSTQMNTHNAAGVAAAAALGAARVTLSREMSIEEIAAMVDAADALAGSEGEGARGDADTGADTGADTTGEDTTGAASAVPLEIEAFGHGALCVCYSGQCLMSSMIGGRSANRGTCAQACRLPYDLHNRAVRKDLPSPGEYLLSPCDLCSIDVLPRLIATGAKSLKIEGRMKSPEYVSTVVGVYRAVIDRIKDAVRFALAKEQAIAGVSGDSCNVCIEGSAADVRSEAFMKCAGSVRATDAERNALAEAFSRGFTTAYLTHERGNDIMSYQRPNNRGVSCGRVAKVNETAVFIESRKKLVKGDVIEIWTGKGRANFVLADAEPDRNGLVKIPFTKVDRDTRAIRVGDRAFRVRNAEAAFDDDALLPAVPVAGRAILHIGQPARVEFWPATSDDAPRAAGPQGVAEGDVVEAARTKAVDAEEVRDHINRMGGTPFALQDFAVELDEGVGIGFSALHHLRADALAALEEALLAPWANRLLAKTEPRSEVAPAPMRGCVVCAWATNPVCARNAKKAGAEAVYVPALNMKRGEAVVAGQRSETVESAGYPKDTVLALPAVNHDVDVIDAQGAPATREGQRGIDVWEQVREDKPVLAENWGDLLRALGNGARVEAGPHIPVTNRMTLELMARLGVERVWLSPELTLAQIEEMTGMGEGVESADIAGAENGRRGGSPVALGLTIIGTQELMITEHCLLMSQGPCDENCAVCPRRKSPHYLHDRKDYDFPVVTDALGRSHLYNSVQLDVADMLPKLIAAGVSAVMVDTTLMNGEEAAQAVGRAVRARDLALRGSGTVAKVSGATSGHLFRAVQ